MTIERFLAPAILTLVSLVPTLAGQSSEGGAQQAENPYRNRHRVGPGTVEIPVPEGHAAVDGQLPELRQHLARFVSPGQRLVVGFLPVEVINKWNAGQEILFDRRIMVTVLTETESRDFTRAAFESVRDSVRDTLGSDLQSEAKKARDQAKEMSRRISEGTGSEYSFELESVRSLGVYLDEPDCIAAAVGVRGSESADGEKSPTNGVGLVYVCNLGGKAVYAFGSAPRSEFESSRTRMTSWIRKVIAANPEPRPGKSLAYRIGQLVGYGLLAGIAVLLVRLLNRMHRRQKVESPPPPPSPRAAP